MADNIKISLFIAKQKAKFYVRHRTIRDQSVSPTLYVSHKLLDPDIIYLSYSGREESHPGGDCPVFSYQRPFIATSIKPSIFKAGKTGKLYIRRCKSRDRSVLSNVYLNHK